MRKILLLMLAVVSTSFSLPFPRFFQEQDVLNSNHNVMGAAASIIIPSDETPLSLIAPIDELKEMLYREAPTLNEAVVNKILLSLKCANGKNIEHNNVLTVIDYSLPSSEKRLWVFDLTKKHLLFHTYVSHGIKSGTLLTNYFSNKNNSKASSIGVYTTEKTYHGRDGLSLILDGLESGFNDNASNRSVVMHGGWYVEETFIKKYGRAGRSWGCPAVPLNLTEPIINTIKNKGLFVVYYPSDRWFEKSKFLNCQNVALYHNSSKGAADVNALATDEPREDVLFAGLNSHKKNDESEAILVMPADSYERIFHNKPPLERMLRRQINQMEYIALSALELDTLTTHNDDMLVHENVANPLSEVYFVIPTIKMVRGYYRTEMKIVNLGKIKNIMLNMSSKMGSNHQFTVHFEENSMINLRSTHQFIRWLGL